MKLLRSISLYFFTFFFNAAISFFTFSFTTHYLSEHDLGVVYLYNAATIFLAPFIGIGMQFVLGVDYFKMPFERYRSHFSSGIVLPFLVAALLTVIFLLLFRSLQNVLPLSFFYIVILPLNCALIAFNEVMIVLVRNREKHALFSVVSIGRNIFEILATIVLIIMVGLHWEGRLISGYLAALVMFLVFLLLVRQWKLWNSNIRFSEIRKIAVDGSPFIPERLAIFAMAYSATFFINAHLGTGEVGLYGSGMQIAFVVNVTILALMSFFHPYIFKGLSQGPDYAKVRKGILAYLGISLFVTGLLILFTPLLFEWFIDDKFREGQVYARLLSIGFFFWSVYGAFVAFLLYMKKNRLIMYISIAGLLLSIGLNAIAVNIFGAIGATYTSMIVYFIMAATMIGFVNRYYSLRKILFN